ncbi:unnamed protein product [Orchesella dallaii]|uniref:C-type lectin domain-containing protein n=1 Tax=Orchesella dallaii TaxID=48710 RepID=A0ABP1R0M8_9HEXA
MKQLGLILILIVVVQIHGQCPKDEGFGRRASLHRVGETRFYIIHGDRRTDYTFDWNGAWNECRRRGNLKLAILDKITTFFMVANYWRTHSKAVYKDTWYWLAAKYEPKDEVYKWYEDKDGKSKLTVNYTNFFYRQPRPIGVGGHQDASYNYQPGRQTSVEQCLAFTFPWPINETDMLLLLMNVLVKVYKGGMLCVKLLEYVTNLILDLTSSLKGRKTILIKEILYLETDCMWSIGDMCRDYPAAKKYCEDLGLEVYNPEADDHCLIPLIKLWARNVTTSQFWVRWTYDPQKKEFYDADGNIQGKYPNNRGNNREKQRPGYFDFEETQDVEGRSKLDDDSLCVSFAHRYEFKVQLYCPKPDDLSCRWHYIYYQTFGSLYCPAGYNMVRERNKEWLSFPSPLTEKDRFKYDFEETYWVVDPEKFQKPKGAKCTISKVVNKKRVLLKVPCTDWHFYLCKKRFKPPMVRKPAPPPGYKEPVWSWNYDQPTPRQYNF